MSWYEAAAVHTDAVAGDGQTDLVVDGNLIDRGTGVLQKNLTILRIIDGQLRVIFDRPESIHVAEPSSVNGKFYPFRDDVKSVFSFKGPESGMKFHYIEELRTSVRNGRSIREKRSYLWRSNLQMFQEVEEAM